MVSVSGRRLQVSPKQKDAILSPRPEGGLSRHGWSYSSVTVKHVADACAERFQPQCRTGSHGPESAPMPSVGDRSKPEIRWTILEDAREVAPPQTAPEQKPQADPQEIDALYPFACHMEWERSEEPSAGWELLKAAQSSHSETRSHASGSAFQFAPSGRNRTGGNTFSPETPTSSGGRNEGALWSRHY
jgi:hypothetical protein